MSNTPTASIPAPTKPSFIRRIFALFLTLLFVAIGGGIVFYSKNTARDPLHDLQMISGRDSPAKTPQAAGPESESQKSSVFEHAASTEMVVVDDSISKLDQTPRPTDETKPIAEFEQPTAEVKNPESSVTIALLEQKITALSEKISELQRTTSQLTENNKNNVAGNLSLLIALNRLQAAVNSEKPFTDALQMMQNLANNNPEIAEVLKPLLPISENGIIGRDALDQEFQAIAKNLLRGQARENARIWATQYAGDGWMANSVGVLASLVTVRRTDLESTNPIELHIAAIETGLRANHLTDALAAAKKIELPSQNDDLQDWMQKLSNRVLAEQTAAKLESLILGRLSDGATVN